MGSAKLARYILRDDPWGRETSEQLLVVGADRVNSVVDRFLVVDPVAAFFFGLVFLIDAVGFDLPRTERHKEASDEILGWLARGIDLIRVRLVHVD